MALTCNSFGNFTPEQYETTAQEVSCQKQCEPIGLISDEEFWTALFRALEAINAGTGQKATIGAIDPQDLNTVVANVKCALQERVYRDSEPEKNKALALYLLNQILCT